MGLVKKILALRKIDKVSTIYSDHLSVELAEDFHIHLRNSRIDMDDREFDKYCRSLMKAYLRWRLIGRPKIGDVDNVGKQVFLCQTKIAAEAGKRNKAVNSDEIRIELQKWTDYIHLHWKWLRAEFSLEEFIEFAETVKQALDNLKDNFNLDQMPRRVGKYHVACPRGRVDREADEEYWVARGHDIQLDHKHKTIFFDEVDRRQRPERKKVPGSRMDPDNNRFSSKILKIAARSRIISRLLGITIS
jgi:hypothetical protein